MKAIITLVLCMLTIVSSAQINEFEIYTNGVVFPRMNTSQRDGLTAITGQCIFNTQAKALECYDGDKWMSLRPQSSKSYGVATSVQKQKLVASDGALNDRFARSVAISGEYAVVGVPFDDDDGPDSGSAYIFRRSGSSWIEEAKITASDGSVNNQFGLSVSIDGDYVIVGTPGDNVNGSLSGSAYIFKRSGNTWTEEAKIAASDGAQFDQFGASVSISEDYAIVGSAEDDDNGAVSGAAYIFRRSGSNWTEQAKITASDAAANNQFGISVSISGDYAVVGASSANQNGTLIGAAYIFHRSGTSWTEESKLIASDGTVNNQFGASVSISGDYVVVGAPVAMVNGADRGAAYIFHRSGVTWMEEAKISATDGASEDLFGSSVSISGTSVVVGAYTDDDSGTSSGSANIYSKSGDSWLEEVKIIASDGETFDSFGLSVSISEDYVIVGANQDDDKGSNSGAAYIY